MGSPLRLPFVLGYHSGPGSTSQRYMETSLVPTRMFLKTPESTTPTAANCKSDALGNPPEDLSNSKHDWKEQILWFRSFELQAPDGNVQPNLVQLAPGADRIEHQPAETFGAPSGGDSESIGMMTIEKETLRFW